MFGLAPTYNGFYRRPGRPLVRLERPRGLKLAFLPEFRDTNEMLSGKPAAGAGFATAAPFTFPYGHAFYMSQAVTATGSIIPYVPANVFSLEALIYCNGAGTQGRILCSFCATDPPGASYDRLLWIKQGIAKFQIFAGGASKIAVAPSIFAQNTLVHIVGVSDGTDIFLYVNGVLVDTRAGGTAYAGNLFFHVGETGEAPDAFVHTEPTQLLAVNYAEAAWSADEVAARFADPYSFYLWPSVSSWMVGMAGGLPKLGPGLPGAASLPAVETGIVLGAGVHVARALIENGELGRREFFDPLKWRR